MNILDLIEHNTQNAYIRKASTGGGEFSGPCPWCGGEDRFSIHPGQNHYVCRQCKKAGDLIQFCKDYLNKTYVEACQLLNIQPNFKFKSLDVGTEAPGSNDIRWTPRELILPCEQWQERAEKFAYHCHKQLFTKYKDIRKQLLNDRGLSDKTILKARIGYNDSHMNFQLESWGLEPEKDNDAVNQSLWLPQGIIIPQFFNDKLIRLRIRQTDQSNSRYVVVKGSSMGFFDYNKHISLDIAFSNHSWMVTESELDGWLLHQKAQNSCIIFSLGSSTARPDKKTHEYLKNNPGLINLDNDDAGHNEMTWWVENYPDAIPYYSIKGKDPGEDFQAGVNVSQWLQDGLSQLNILNNGDKKEQGKTSLNFKKKIIDRYNKDLSNKKQRIVKIKDDFNYLNQKKKEKLLSFAENYQGEFKSQPQAKECLHNDYCISLKQNICLINNENVHQTNTCPKEKWYRYIDGNVTQIIYGPGMGIK